MQLLLGVYGGYFGGAVGIMMMAAWSLLGATDMHAMTASRTLIVGVTNAIAAVVFVIGGLIVWPQTLTMLVTATIGGYVGGGTDSQPRSRESADRDFGSAIHNDGAVLLASLFVG